MEINLENIENRVGEVIKDIVGGEKSYKLWSTIQNMLRKEQQKLTDEVGMDLQNLAEELYREMFQILGEDVEDLSEAETIAKKIAQDAVYEIRDMFENAGVVNKNGFYSTFDRYASDLEKAIDKVEDSDEYEQAMEEYVEKTADAGVVYKDGTGRAKRLASGIKSTVRRAEQQLGIVMAAEIGESMGADGMYISWHADPRASHDFGGVAYTMQEYERNILPKLLEPNCKHRAYPVILDKFDYVNIPSYLNHLMAENNKELDIGNETNTETGKNNYSYLSMGLGNVYGALNVPGYRNKNDLMNEFPSITQAIKETNDKLAKINKEIRKAKEREEYLRSIRFTKEADKELEKIRELESEKKALTKQNAVMREAEQKKWYDYLWDGSVKLMYEGGKIIVSFANGLAGGAVKALTFGLVDPKLDALIKDPNTIAYKAGNIVGEVGTGIAAFFINPISGAGAAVTTAGEVVQVTAAMAKAIIAGSAAKAAVSDVIQFASDGSNSSSGGENKEAENTVTSNKGNVYDNTPSSNHSTTTKNPGYKGEPNSSVDIVNPKTGEIQRRRWFGPDGKATRDLDMTNHGNPKQHPEFPHEHIWEYNLDGTPKSR